MGGGNLPHPHLHPISPFLSFCWCRAGGMGFYSACLAAKLIAIAGASLYVGRSGA